MLQASDQGFKWKRASDQGFNWLGHQLLPDLRLRYVDSLVKIYRYENLWTW